ncbi:serine protease [Bacteriovorax sp. PP10]|uniref:Serine protease n=1 Tax=Bacteriovorax antarcticus TaxID=3088717 RepID=A0ABU5VZ23_9BACT|nr:serine protease [Bacteriovorax sp. PP10]MEA9358308.1 serine protease [Bacteriovorax sp. PP10]
MKFLLTFTFLIAALSAHASMDKVIYGEDNRRMMSELDSANDTQAIKYSSSILAQIPNWRMTSTKETISVTTRDLKSGLNICDGEKFLEQPLVASCTAFLVGPDLIVTAGHCIKDKYDCKKQTWILDYDSAGDFTGPKGTINFPKDKSYTCKDLVSWSENNNLDYALIKLDREVVGRTPLKVRREGKVASNESLMVIGHPLGMPKMLADNILVRDNSSTFFFKTNADTFSGNSGSPVFGAVSGMVEGILVRGDEDFEMDIDLGCQRMSRCGDKDCRGESVQRSTYLPFKNIPKI